MLEEYRSTDDDARLRTYGWRDTLETEMWCMDWKLNACVADRYYIIACVSDIDVGTMKPADQRVWI